MKFIAILLLAVPFAHAGVVRFGYKHVAKPAFNHVVKPAAKVASFPVRHPKTTAKASGHAAAKTAKVIF
jgi:hypothetical protein